MLCIIEFGPSEYFHYSYRTTWKFHDVPEKQKIRPHTVTWSLQGESFSEKLSVPLENEEERVLDITWNKK